MAQVEVQTGTETDIEKENSEEISSESSSIVPTSTTSPPITSFSQVYLGPALSCEVKSLQPAAVYLFRVQVRNSL